MHRSLIYKLVEVVQNSGCNTLCRCTSCSFQFIYIGQHTSQKKHTTYLANRKNKHFELDPALRTYYIHKSLMSCKILLAIRGVRCAYTVFNPSTHTHKRHWFFSILVFSMCAMDNRDFYLKIVSVIQIQ